MDDPMKMEDPAPAPVASGSRGAWRLALLAPLLSLLVTQPWMRHPFPVWDYAEMLPLLRRSHGWLGAFQSLAEFYRAQGRANYLTYAQIALTWGIAGDNPAGWQLQRALFMVAASVLLVVTARRLGATPLAAGLGALLFAVSVPGTEGWLFLMGEPLAVILILLMVLVGAGYRTAPRWGARAVALALLTALVLLTKEVLGIMLPVVLLFAISYVPGAGFRRPALGPRERLLGALLLGVLILEAWSVRGALAAALPAGYATAYGSGGLAPARIATLLQAMALPARFSGAGAATDLYPANLAFLLLLLLGIAQPQNGNRRPSGWPWWVLGLLSLPLLGAIAYSLWPRYSAFYGIPFFAASAGLLVLAASAVERSHAAGRWVTLLLGSAAVVYSAFVADRVISEKHALSSLALSVVEAFPRAPRLDTVFVVSPRQGGRRWPVNARELRGYARAMGVPDDSLPVLLDAPCEAIGRRLASPLGRNGILADQNPCGRLPARTLVWTEEVRYRDWVSFGKVRDTVVVEILAPAWKGR